MELLIAPGIAIRSKDATRAPGHTTSNKKLLEPPGLTTRSKDARREKKRQCFLIYIYIY